MSNNFLLITSQEAAAAAVESVIAATVELAAATAVTDVAAVAVLADRLSSWAAWQASKDKDGENMSIFSVFWREQGTNYVFFSLSTTIFYFFIGQN